jgi:hypothetical protein
MQSKQILFAATLGQTMSAFAAQAAPVTITTFPYTIVAPGTYVVATQNFVLPTVNAPEITINVRVPGKVVLNLNHVDFGPYIAPGSPGLQLDNFSYSCILVEAGQDIVIENGAICNGAYSCGIGIDVNPLNPTPEDGFNNSVELLTINGITFGGCNTACIRLNQINAAHINNCYFDDDLVGILDYGSSTGNYYSNDSFEGISRPIDLDSSGAITSDLHPVPPQQN